jgi:hypothetical protein
MERRAHARPQPASMDGDVRQTLLTNWGCRGKRGAPAGSPVPRTGAPPPNPAEQVSAHSAPDEFRRVKGSRHSSASCPSTANGTSQTSSTKRVEFTDAKNIASARQQVGKERFFTTEDFATGFVGITSVNSNRGLLGSVRVLPSPRRGRRTGSCDNKTDREVRERDFTGN